jgi:hypothetical protein
MGRFSDAFKAGEAEKQAAADAEKKGQDEEKQARDRQADVAVRWFDEVLTPVLTEAKADLQSSGLVLDFVKAPGDPIQAGITIRGHNKAESATVHVSSNGAIASFTGSGQRSTLKGDVNSTPREHVARWLEGIVKEMAKA